jgi:hypothetical protein
MGAPSKAAQRIGSLMVTLMLSSGGFGANATRGTSMPVTSQCTKVNATIFVAVMFCSLPLIPVHANDSSAELATGGLVFVKNNNIEMISEDLFISTKEIRVRYRFRNRAAKDIVTHVAFPLPDLKMDLIDDTTALPTDIRSSNRAEFLGFSTEVDGHRISANVEQRALLNGQDQISTLKRLGLSLSPFDVDVFNLADPTIAELERFKLLNEDNIPLWTLKTTFYWEQRFLAGRETLIEHRYKPSVGTFWSQTIAQSTGYGIEALCLAGKYRGLMVRAYFYCDGWSSGCLQGQSSPSPAGKGSASA